jgi:tRNA(Ile)-lysidine synthase
MQEKPYEFDLRLTGIKKSSKILVGISGGADSIFLARSLHRKKYSIGLAHVNYMLRGKESNKDQDFVREMAHELNVPFYTKIIALQEYKNESKKGTQELARDLRYSWFKELLASEKYDYIAVGHHGTDQVETFVGNVIRGTGILGLGGMRFKKGQLLRPLLHLSSDNIRQGCSENNWSFRKDKSNDSLDYTRNKIRHLVLPALSTVRPDACDQTLKSIWNIQEHLDLYQSLLDSLLTQNIQETPYGQELNKNILRTIPNPHIFLHHWLGPYGFNMDQCRAMASSDSAQTGSVFQSSSLGTKIFVNALNLSLESNQEGSSVQIEISECGTFTIGKHSWKVDRYIGVPKRTENILYLKPDKISFPFTIRTWEKGDRIQPLGMSGSKLISDVLIDQKIPFQRKQEQCILLKKDDVLWLSGLKTSELVRHAFEDRAYIRVQVLS